MCSDLHQADGGIGARGHWDGGGFEESNDVRPLKRRFERELSWAMW